jgi:mannitol 2-dehydrogenase
VYLHRLLQAGAPPWTITGIGTQPGDRLLHEVLTAQDHLYTVAERPAEGEGRLHVVGSLIDHIWVPADPLAALDRLVDPATAIVTLTITEGGYGLARPDDELVLDDALTCDLAQPTRPRTVHGLLVEALVRRRANGTAPFTVASCDNIQHNGAVARAALAGFALAREERLGDWVLGQVAFPASMVDRITPVTTERDRADIATRIGMEDRWPVVCEPYVQWVLEDTFPSGRPPLEDVGVQVVPDVMPYEQLKLRLLNGGHQALAQAGRLLGYTFVHEAVADPLLAAFTRRYVEEAGATLPPVPGVDVAAYIDSVLDRFGNPRILDTLERICAYSSDRIPAFLSPVIDDAAREGRATPIAAAVLACWAHHLSGTQDFRGGGLVDHRAGVLQVAATGLAADPCAPIRAVPALAELVSMSGFVEHYTRTLDVLRRRGARSAVEAVVAPRRD